MTLEGSLPADLHQWVVGHLPGVTTATDTSWPRGDSRVWRLDSGTTAAYLKVSPSPASYTREEHAYRHAAAVLTDDEAPRLLASDPALRATLTTALQGRVVRTLRLSVAAEGRAHGLAGSLLRRWHDHPEPIPPQARETVMTSMSRQAAEAAACLDGFGEHLAYAERALVEEVARDLPVIASRIPLVYLHGDHSPRNWLWHAERETETETLAVIDFEMADHGLAVQDMVWLCGAMWSARPDLHRSFLVGYGRELTDDEHRALLLLTTRLAVSYLATGLAKQEPALIDRGRKALADLARAHI